MEDPIKALQALHQIQELETQVLTMLDQLFEMRVRLVEQFCEPLDPAESPVRRQ
jgi:hypothetical protein